LSLYIEFLLLEVFGISISVILFRVLGRKWRNPFGGQGMKTDIRCHSDNHLEGHIFPTQLKIAGMARRHPCPSEEHGGAVGGSSTKMEQDAPEPKGNRASFFRSRKVENAA